MTLFPIYPHTQGIIEISLKTPKTPYIIQKKKEFPQSEPKTNPHTTKKKLSGYPQEFLNIQNQSLSIPNVSRPSA